MPRTDQNALKLELMRVRASVERAELLNAMRELRSATQPLRSLLGAAEALAERLRERRDGLPSLAATAWGLLRERPWLLAALATSAGRRGIPRWVLLGGLAAAAAVARFVQRATATPKNEARP